MELTKQEWGKIMKNVCLLQNKHNDFKLNVPQKHFVMYDFKECVVLQVTGKRILDKADVARVAMWLGLEFVGFGMMKEKKVLLFSSKNGVLIKGDFPKTILDE